MKRGGALPEPTSLPGLQQAEEADENQNLKVLRSVERDSRLQALQEVYRQFDLDGSGQVGKDEIFMLGQCRRKLGQREGEWTEQMNASMMANMGVDSFGNVSMRNFVEYFDEKLPHIPQDFADTIAQFTACAYDLRDRMSRAAEPEVVMAEKSHSPSHPARRSPNADSGQLETTSTVECLKGKKVEAADSPERKEQLRRLAEIEGMRRELTSANKKKSPPRNRGPLMKPLPDWMAHDSRSKVSEQSEELKLKIAEKNRREIDEIRRDMKALSPNHRSVALPASSRQQSQQAIEAELDSRIAFRKPERDATVAKRKQEIKRMRDAMKQEEVSSSTRIANSASAGSRPDGIVGDVNRFDPVVDLKRRRLLSQVFFKFDLDNNGVVSSRELKKLGTARRTLGQKENAWTESRNLKLLRKMDVNDDGQIDKEEFVAHFNEALPASEEVFMTVIAQFMEVAAHCRR